MAARLSPARGWDVLLELTRAEIKQERELSLPGVAKWILEPLSYTVVYFLLVVVILNRNRFAYPLFLLCALVPWRYFTGVVFRSMGLLRSYASLISNRSVPKAILPAVVLASEVPTFLLAITLLAPMMAYFRIVPTPALLWLPVVVGVLLLLSSGPCYLGAVFGLYFPDYRGAVQNLIRMGFFMSTALVPAAELPGEELPRVLDLNPVSGIFDSMRAIVLEGRAPHPFDLLYPAAVGLGVLLAGVVLYRHRQDQFAKDV
jgi:ABC-type polysaccharide/polyol phosphate export permease